LDSARARKNIVIKEIWEYAAHAESSATITVSPTVAHALPVGDHGYIKSLLSGTCCLGVSCWEGYSRRDKTSFKRYIQCTKKVATSQGEITAQSRPT
jgi:hypothetical protein